MGQVVNPVVTGHIAFRTDDIEAVKQRLRESDVPFSDYGVWAVAGWHQIFFTIPRATSWKCIKSSTSKLSAMTLLRSFLDELQPVSAVAPRPPFVRIPA